MRRIKKPKAAGAQQCVELLQLPNVGPAMAADLRLLGIERPADLINQDAYLLYRRLERATGQAHDPCVLDSLMAVVDFMQGAAAQPWWAYTAQRKRRYGNLSPLQAP